ncbi:MAG: HD domain-containing protein, partial [Chloroflexi bacterium]|nr:HD domain-containing protein [Chloroflexota bacterium]
MAESLVGAIGDLMRLQRWNAMPRVEIWTEAENIACVTHTVYAVGRTRGIRPDLLMHGISRALLKSFIKHYISDIPAPTREVIREKAKTAWPHVINIAAKQSASLFPMEISSDVQGYMTQMGDYSTDSDKQTIEDLIRFAQEKAALRECTTNMRVYPDFYDALGMSNSIDERLKNLKDYEKLEKSYSDLKDYLIRIENLKNLRRWNRINRSVETTVLGHTFVVAFLTLIVSKLHNKRLQGSKGARVKEYNAILRALFHDLPEAFTGDIITPVKQIDLPP